jgi:hypothetical protein
MKVKKNKNLKNKNFIYRKKNSLSLKNTIEKKEKIEKKKIKNNYLYKNKKLKKGIILKKPKFNEILYPFFLNLKLVNEYLKKK